MHKLSWEIVKLLAVGIVCTVALMLSFGCSTLDKAGLYQMSDEWCSKHPAASSSRCADRVNDCATHPSGWCKGK